jgi:hypothetical protein
MICLGSKANLAEFTFGNQNFSIELPKPEPHQLTNQYLQPTSLIDYQP